MHSLTEVLTLGIIIFKDILVTLRVKDDILLSFLISIYLITSGPLIFFLLRNCLFIPFIHFSIKADLPILSMFLHRKLKHHSNAKPSLNSIMMQSNCRLLMLFTNRISILFHH